MRIEKLTLRGFLRFRDTVTIDLTDVPAGLVAIVGPNGSGKTTLLEAGPAGLFRSFMSRGDIADYATTRESFLDLQLAIDGRGTYRARINVDGIKRSSDAVLEAVQPDGTRRKLNDGKVTTFDQVVAREFPSKDVLLASAFASQNKAGSFITLDKKRRKDLFAQLLGIERYQTMADTARRAAALVEEARVRLQARRDVLLQDTADSVAASLDARVASLQIEGTRAAADQAACKQEIDRLEAQAAVLADVVAAYSAAAQRLRSVEHELQARTTERDRLTQEIATADAAVPTALAQHEASLASALERLDLAVHAAESRAQAERVAAADRCTAVLADIAKKRANNQHVLELAEQIHAAVARSAAIQQELTAVDGLHAAATSALQTARDQVVACDRELATFEVTASRLAAAQRDAALLASVPCGGSGSFAACQFLTNATAAQATVGELQVQLERRVAVGRQRTDAVAAVAYRQMDLADQTERISGLRVERDEIEKMAKYAAPLAAATARLAELDEQASQAERDHASALDAVAARLASALEDLQARRTQTIADGELARGAVLSRHHTEQQARHQRMADLAAAITRLSADRDEASQVLTRAQSDNQVAQDLQATLRVARQTWDSLTATVARIEAGQLELARRREELSVKQQQLADVRARLATLDAELLEWQGLAKAFGRDGLAVLEIDAAGPTISAYTNELLEVCFGPRFTVELATQQAKADGKGMKEDFSIRVMDNASGGDARDIADLSGGEQVIVAEALSNAICIYVNTRSPLPVRTCWRDETTGALDPENAARYMAMLRKVQELGGFHHILYVSHNAEAAAMADAQIQVNQAGVSIAFPPYRVAA